MVKSVGTHNYGQDCLIWEISTKAAHEKRDNWTEIPDVAAGYAIVEHQDWKDLYREFLNTFPKSAAFYSDPWRYGPSFLVHAVTPDGKAAHLGSFHAKDGKIELDG